MIESEKKLEEKLRKDVKKHLGGWEGSSSTKNFKIYGKQKYYKKI